MASAMELDVQVTLQDDSETSSRQTPDTGDTSPESDESLERNLSLPVSTNGAAAKDFLPYHSNENPNNSTAREEFFADISNYIPLGSLICESDSNLSEQYHSEEFQETDHFPASFTRITSRTQRQIQRLCYRNIIRIFARKRNDGTTHTRVYVLPDDVGRSFAEREHKKLRHILLELIYHLDNSHEVWDGRKSERQSSYDLGSKNNDSLFYIYNRLPSPTIGEVAVSCPYSKSAIQEILDSGTLRGLKTSLYPYQKRTVAIMIKKEVQPARTLDPRLQPLTSPTGTVFYLDAQAGYIFRDRREYDESCGGILGESMGLGKTLICLATILSTKGHWPSIPPEYSLDLHPIRPQVASLMTTAAAAVAQARIPWKPFFHEMLTSGEDLTNCRTLLEENIPYYEIPVTGLSRATRRPSAMPKGRLVKLCSATLVIVPQNLLSQWRNELVQHIEEGELAVLCLDTPGNVPLPSAEQLQLYDIILMSRPRLEREILPSENAKFYSKGNCRCSHVQSCNACLNNFQSQCPLKDLHFLRVIMDEGHEFSSYGHRNNTYWALQQLQVERKWIVSGTPSSGLMGVEVGAAASETVDAARAQSRMTNAAILQSRRKEIALSQERKDLDKLGGLVVGFLKLRPWANKGDDFAMWSKHIMPATDGTRKPASLQQLLQSLVVRHRIEDIEADLKLPPLYNRVVYLKPSWCDKVSINLFVMALVTNFVTSERTDEDYMFHPKNRRFLNSLITNLRQANFYWTSWTPEQVIKTMQASSTYLEDHSSPETACSENDQHLLQQGIKLGEIILQCKAWKSLAEIHEMGIFVEKFPEGAQHAWTLTERERSDPLMIGATQMIKAQEWVDSHVNLRKVEGIVSGLSEKGTRVMRKLWAQEDEVPDPHVVTNRKQRPLGPAGIPKLTQKLTVSRVKASPKQNSLDHDHPIWRFGSGNRAALDSDSVLKPTFETSDMSSGAPTLLPDSTLAEAKIIGTTSTKLSYLLDQVTRLHTTEKILVFYEGDHIAYYVAQGLELLSIRHLIYTGTLSPARQSAYVATFNTTSTFRVLLMDVHQAAHGLHIASASRVFFVNPIWQPNVEAQAIKRAHRIGQTKPVYVETLVLEGTFEDQMLQRRWGMTAEEHQKAEKSLLDDDTMSTIIKKANFVPFQEDEVQNIHNQIARLQIPQQLFGRPDRPTGDANNPDADLIFPEGTPKKSRKRKPNSENAPDMAASPRTPTKQSLGSLSSSSSPMTQRASTMDTAMECLDVSGSSTSPQPVVNGLPVRSVHFAIDEPETSNPAVLFGGAVSSP